MRHDETILEKLQNGEFKLRKSEQKVANWVMENAGETTALNITTIAQKIGVSEPTIVRFCRAVGCKGYQEFKIKFAEDLALGKINESIDIKVDDTTEAVKDKVAQFARAAISNVDREIDSAQLELATQALMDANRVIVCGFGASNCTAFDSFHKLFRMTPKVGYHPDMHMSAMAVGSLQPNDAIIAISNSGKSEALISLCKLARSNGAKVITITDPDSPVDQTASIRLNIKKQVDTGLFVPMAHRLKQLTIIDFLVYNYARLNEQDAQQRLQKTKTALTDLKQQHSII
ncbi:MurR/RpiR family transcriptional regulator [Fangia hongkongensis]|uniref:MurR/RpiR family transcriptional regulator n=1 Tax=Fangia hongkongensis TaxID=270495 RepID=UPI000366D815|nr:MurR/RpiR family transcriptional regulator [Fangia hongkongensis]MBK2125922.1 MurR/RpiR family transcriptional regulator [Fangia hongkongensis]